MQNAHDEPHQADALLSHSSILIFSGVLIGLALSLSLSTAMSRLVLLTGLQGMIAYFALGIVASRQRQRTANAANRLAISRLEKRLDRHNPRSGPSLPPTARYRLSEEEEQYLTVVRTSRIAGVTKTQRR